MSSFSLTRCRRISPLWNNRSLPSRPTWRDSENKIRKNMPGPSLMLAGHIYTRYRHRLLIMPTVKCLWSTVTPPLPPRLLPRWIQVQPQKQTILSHCARGWRYISLPQSDDVCAYLEGRNDLLKTYLNADDVVVS